MGGSRMTLSSNNAALTVPVSIPVVAGATTATFSAMALPSIASNQSATLTATLGSSSKTATISLVAPVLVSTLACAPTALRKSTVSTFSMRSLVFSSGCPA
jgi:trimeric autotransporter adhesin